MYACGGCCNSSALDVDLHAVWTDLSFASAFCDGDAASVRGDDVDPESVALEMADGASVCSSVGTIGTHASIGSSVSAASRYVEGVPCSAVPACARFGLCFVAVFECVVH